MLKREFILRAATADDARSIAEVHVASWRTTYPGIIPTAFLDSLSVDKRTDQWRRNLNQLVRMHQTMVVTERDQICGFISCGPARTEVAGSNSEVSSMYLLASCQRIGLGRKLMAIAARRLADSGFTHAHVWVAEANPATAFYERIGGRRVAQRVEPIAGIELAEVALGFDDLATLAAPAQPLPWVIGPGTA